MGVAPVLIIDLIFACQLPFPVIALFCVALCKPGAEQLKCKSELGLGLRKKVMKCQQEQDASGQGEGWMLKCAEQRQPGPRWRKVVWNTWPTTPTGHPDSNLGQNVAGCSCSIRVEVKAFALRVCWFSSPPPFPLLKTRSLMEEGISKKPPVLCWKYKLAWKLLIRPKWLICLKYCAVPDLKSTSLYGFKKLKNVSSSTLFAQLRPEEVKSSKFAFLGSAENKPLTGLPAAPPALWI